MHKARSWTEQFPPNPNALLLRPGGGKRISENLLGTIDEELQGLTEIVCQLEVFSVSLIGPRPESGTQSAPTPAGGNFQDQLQVRIRELHELNDRLRRVVGSVAEFA